jgi:hypothetical protein
MPNMATVLTGATSNTWEVCPSVARDLNFSLIVRDNNSGIGQTATDLMKVTVNGTAGPFLVSAPIQLFLGQQELIKQLHGMWLVLMLMELMLNLLIFIYQRMEEQVLQLY